MTQEIDLQQAETSLERSCHFEFVQQIFGASSQSLLGYSNSHLHTLQDGLRRRFTAYPSSEFRVDPRFWGNSFEDAITGYKLANAYSAMRHSPEEVMRFLREYYSAVGFRMLTNVAIAAQLQTTFPEMASFTGGLESAFNKDAAIIKLNDAGKKMDLDLTEELRKIEFG
ncbi:hypothetical protein HYU13_03435 [Candidatus Woesearchaeota archaeon]|nr:hypothetical protein [Candidatus Woesearchaeota archaeon]